MEKLKSTYNFNLKDSCKEIEVNLDHYLTLESKKLIATEILGVLESKVFYTFRGEQVKWKDIFLYESQRLVRSLLGDLIWSPFDPNEDSV